MNLGKNTESGRQLVSIIERVESLRVDKKALADAESAVMAEAKSAGFVPGVLRRIIKIRAMKPHDRQESEALTDTYLHAIGMADETPLFRHVGLMNVDKASRDDVVEALKKFVPENGSIVVEAGGKPIRLTRDKTGEVTATEVVEAAPTVARAVPGALGSMPARADVPAVDDAGAEAMGREAFGDNTPVIANPFPFGDPRRARWDEGWRNAGGGDGMGPG